MKLHDYLHYYIGCRIERDSESLEHPTLIGIKKDHAIISGYSYKTPHSDQTFFRPPTHLSIDSIKPILRKLDDITDEEIKELIGWDKLNELYVDVSFERGNFGITVNYSIDAGDEGVHSQTHRISFHVFSPKEWKYLLSKGFDLFFLIKNGLAIDYNTLK